LNRASARKRLRFFSHEENAQIAIYGMELLKHALKVSRHLTDIVFDSETRGVDASPS
jgi:phage replication-related protein YjqB (UPF0714/DUF867 family)